MRSTIRLLSTLAAGAVVGLAVHTPVSAQGTRLLSAPAATTAEQLEATALQEKQMPHDWLVAGKTLEQAARLRSARDTLAIDDLIVASTAYNTGGAYTQARLALESAGNRAERAGQYGLAARAYLDAFQLCAQIGEEDLGTLYLDRLASVAYRPGVPESYREVVRTVDRMHDER